MKSSSPIPSPPSQIQGLSSSSSSPSTIQFLNIPDQNIEIAIQTFQRPSSNDPQLQKKTNDHTNQQTSSRHQKTRTISIHFLFGHANGLCKELWNPVIRCLDRRLPVDVHPTFYTYDARNSGDSGVRNAQKKKESDINNGSKKNKKKKSSSNEYNNDDDDGDDGRDGGGGGGGGGCSDQVGVGSRGHGVVEAFDWWDAGRDAVKVAEWVRAQMERDGDEDDDQGCSESLVVGVGHSFGEFNYIND
jgi:hypothetical protein